MKPFIIALAVIVLGGLGYMGYSQIRNEPDELAVKLATATTTAANSSNKKIAFSELVKQGGSYECTVKQAVSDMESDGVVFMDKDRLRGEFSTQAQGMKIDTTMILKDGYTYTWSSAMPKNGFKIQINPPIKAGADTGVDNSVATSGTYNWNAEQIGDYYCKVWTVDESKFTLPVDRTFTDIKR